MCWLVCGSSSLVDGTRMMGYTTSLFSISSDDESEKISVFLPLDYVWGQLCERVTICPSWLCGNMKSIIDIIFSLYIAVSQLCLLLVRFLHLIKVLTNHNRTLTRYIWYQWCSKMTGVMFYDKEYSCLSKLQSHRGVWQVLYYLYILKSIHLIKHIKYIYIISRVKIFMLCIQ